VNDAAVSLRLVVFVSKVQRFYIQITDRLDGGGREAVVGSDTQKCIV
jgi:hypothetical protein